MNFEKKIKAKTESTHILINSAKKRNKKKKKAFFAGSFDPFTIGHLNIALKACELFDDVYIGIGKNENKKRTYSEIKMKEAIENLLTKQKISNVFVVIYGGMTYEQAKNLGCNWLVRGLRNEKDFIYEETVADYNEKIGNLQTIYFRADENLKEISSSKFKEMNSNEMLDEQKNNMIPKEILEILQNH